MTRRLVLLLLGVLAGAAGVASSTASPSGHRVFRLGKPGLPPGPLRAALEALLDTILPDGEYPGYRASGVLAHVTGVFTVAHRPLPPLHDLLAGLDRRARARAGRAFVDLDPAERRALLLEVQQRGERWARAFGPLRAQALDAHYAHPVVWNALAFPHAPQPRGYLDYQEPPGG